jgi:hypothetical protein
MNHLNYKQKKIIKLWQNARFHQTPERKKIPTRNYCGQNNRDWYIFFSIPKKRIKRNYLLLYPLKRSLPLFKTRYTLCYYSHCELLKSPPVWSSHRTNIVHHQYAFVPFLLNILLDSSILFSHAEFLSQILYAEGGSNFFQEIKWHAVEVNDRLSGRWK